MSSSAHPRFVAVIDVGKTNAKLVLVDLETCREIAVRKRTNIPVSNGLYPHADTDGIWDFFCASLAELNRLAPIDAISTTTHGACAALIDSRGELVLPVLDYEHPGPETYDEEYRLVRPGFLQSMSAPLPGGLNLAKQLFWQSRKFSEDFARARWILLYPQYWGFRLSGIAASEISSIGCHTDLWNFENDRFSNLVTTHGWQRKFAPFRRASEVLGTIRPELAQKLGLQPDIAVHVGIHDSNASLLPHLLSRTVPFAVVSTGTWVVACAPGGNPDHLDPARDSYSNIDIFGRHVPSARFMGGREFTNLIGDDVRKADLGTIRQVLENRWMLLPSVSRRSGPFPMQDAHMTVAHASISPQAHFAIVSFYLAMMTAQCLTLTGASGEIIVEGPFVENDLFLQMLRCACDRPVLVQKSNSTGTSIGAALLVAEPATGLASVAEIHGATPLDTKLAAYAKEWRNTVKARQP